MAPPEDTSFSKARRPPLPAGYAKARTLGVPVTRDELRQLESCRFHQTKRVVHLPSESPRVTQPLGLCKILPSSLQIGLESL